MTRRAVLITGGSSGIGLATVDLLLDRGYDVVVVDLAGGDGSGAEEARHGSGGLVVSVAGDAADPAVMRRAVEIAGSRLGRLDGLVLNAGITGSDRVDTVELDRLRRVIEVNTVALVVGMQAAVPLMRSGGGGSIVVTSSVSGLGGEPRHVAYGTAKAGAINLARCAAVDLAADGIRVNTVCPGPVHTSMTEALRIDSPDRYEALRRAMPMQRWGEAAEVAEVIAFLLSPAASFLTGVTLPVDGGMTARTAQFLPPDFQAPLRRPPSP